MTQQDYYLFERSVRDVLAGYPTLRQKLKPAALDELTRSYFQVLEAFPLDDVLRAGRACVGKHKKFPMASEWLSAIGTTAPRTAPAECRQMSTSELDEFAGAEQARWFDSPCLCSECCRAGVDDLAVRFVPSLAGDDEERAYNPRRNVVQIVGHWAHGDELRRWYEAKAAYVTTAQQCPPRLRLMPALREPGEED